MNEFKVGDFIVWEDRGYDNVYEIESMTQRRIYAYVRIDGERKGMDILQNHKRKLRHATPEEIKAGRRLP